MLAIRIGDLEEETETRARNADYLSGELEKIEGIRPPRVMHWTRRHGYHLYAMLYDAETFGVSATWRKRPRRGRGTRTTSPVSWRRSRGSGRHG